MKPAAFFVSLIFFITLLKTSGADVQPEKMGEFSNLPSALSALETWAKKNDGWVEVLEIGKSHGGKKLLVYQLSSAKGESAKNKPALFLMGSLRGDDSAGSLVLEELLNHFGEEYSKADSRVKAMLDEVTVYVLPCPNPDALSLFCKSPFPPQSAGLNPVDEDGDGKSDEDGPDDLNGDGFITQMLVPDPRGDWNIDPQDSRFLVQRSPGEKGKYRILTEGKDDDGDGEYNEDGPGGVLLDQNFPVAWEHAEGKRSGTRAMSEPETAAIVKFMTEHKNILLSIYYSNEYQGLLTPSFSRKDRPGGQKGDVYSGLWRYYSDFFDSGSQNFAYAGAGPKNGTFLDWAAEGLDSDLGQPLRFALQAGLWVDAPKAKPIGPQSPDLWLRWNDAQEINRFVLWQDFKDPVLGDLKIGGWIPWGKANPPADYWPLLFDNNRKWIEKILTEFPKRSLKLESVEIKTSTDKYDVKQVNIVLDNTAFLPLNAQWVELQESDKVKLLQGSKKMKSGVVWGFGNSDQKPESFGWLLKIAKDCDTITVKVGNGETGFRSLDIKLK